MAEILGNLDNMLRDWAKDKVESVLSRLRTVREAGRRKKKPFLFYKLSRKNTRAVSVGSRARLNEPQSWS